MKGRWNVLPDSERNGTWIALDPDKNIGIPVVPCDDAAVERAARELCREGIIALDGKLSTWERHADNFRVMAARCLRAAGETP